MIGNAKNKKLGQTNPGLPDVSSAMEGFFVPMVFIKVVKTVVDFVVEETEQEIEFRGVWQVMGERELKLLPEGERSNSWYTVHSDRDLKLGLDEIIKYQGVKYRIMKNVPHEIYGYREYKLKTETTE